MDKSTLWRYITFGLCIDSVLGGAASPTFPRGRCTPLKDLVLNRTECVGQNLPSRVFVFDEVTTARSEEKIAVSVDAVGLGTAKCKAMLTTVLCHQSFPACLELEDTPRQPDRQLALEEARDLDERTLPVAEALVAGVVLGQQEAQPRVRHRGQAHGRLAVLGQPLHLLVERLRFGADGREGTRSVRMRVQ